MAVDVVDVEATAANVEVEAVEETVVVAVVAAPVRVALGTMVEAAEMLPLKSTLTTSLRSPPFLKTLLSRKLDLAATFAPVV